MLQLFGTNSISEDSFLCVYKNSKHIYQNQVIQYDVGRLEQCVYQFRDS